MQYFETGGARLAYEEAGPEMALDVNPGEGVAFLNGIAMTIAHWKPLLPAFSGRYRCLFHDMRGQLNSSKPEEEYSLSLHARDLAALAVHLGYTSLHLVGTSYGAEVAVTFALEYPELCASLVLIDGVSETDDLLSATVESWKRAAAVDPVTFYRCILPWNYSSGYIRRNRELLAKREAAMAAMPREYFTAFIRLCDAFLAIDLTPRLHEIRCPASILVASDDILKHRKFADILARGIPGATLTVIPDAGHAVVIESPDLVARLARDFIDTVSRKQPA